MDADRFLSFIFADAQGAVVTCNAEEGFKARRWTPGKTLKGCAYFCISTVRDDKPRDQVLCRQTQDLVLTYDIVLDDVGTKVDRARLMGLLPPTIITETSPANFQWHYVLAEGAPPDRAAALIEALARAGLTDMGARRADRVMRVPGSVNEKYGAPFLTRVLEAHEDRLYTFSQICVGLGVTPVDTPMLVTGPRGLADGAADPVEQWLYDHDQVLGGPNPRGWIPVRCPLEAEHTGDVDHGADYLPGMPGVFKCMHSHGDRLTTGWFRSWIQEQDPSADLAIVPRAAMAELGQKLAAALGMKPTPPPEDSQTPSKSSNEGQPTLSQAAWEDLQARLAQGGLFARPEGSSATGEAALVRAAVLGDLVHVASEDAYWSIETGCLISHKAVDDRWYAVMRGAGLLDSTTPAGNPTIIAPHIWLRRSAQVQRMSKITHRLGAPLIVEDCLNLAPPIPARLATLGEPEPWLDLISFICKDVAADIELVLDWMSLVVTNWGEKPGWHLLMRGEHGTGKNLAVRPLVKYTKPHHHRNVSAADIGGQFNTFLTKRLISVDELKMNSRGSISAHDVYNNLKAWTARGYDTLTINQKHHENYEASDLSCWVITSNEAVPLPLEEGDRRFMVIETPRVPWPVEDYEDVVAWLDRGGDEVAVSWLHRRWDILSEARRSRLRGRAPDTEAKRTLIDASAEGIEGAVRLAIAGQHCTPWPDLMRLEDVVERLKDGSFQMITDQMRRQINIQRVIPALKAAGAVRMFGGTVIAHGDRNMRIWCVRASKLAYYEKLGQGKILLDAYAELRAGRIPKPFLNVVPSQGV